MTPRSPEIVSQGNQPTSSCDTTQSAAAPDTAPHLLHVFPSFEVGGVQVRTTAIINNLKRRYRHTILALSGDDRCRSRIDDGLEVSYLTEPPHGGGLIASLIFAKQTLAALRPDLLLTYNWGTMDWAAVNSFLNICPHIHHEDGFNLDEADRQKLRRILYRRLCLRRKTRVIVPSKSLYGLATKTWKVNEGSLIHIANGIDGSTFQASGPPAKPEALRDLPVIGAVAPLRPEKNLQLLIQAVASLGPETPVGLLIAGDGPERSRLEARAQGLEPAIAVVFLGLVEDVARTLSMIDIFALTSQTEQMPLSVLQAMAAAKPVVSVDVGDVKRMVSPDHRPFIVPRDDAQALMRAFRDLLADARKRHEVGRANAAWLRDHYREDVMIEAHARVIAETLRQSAAPRHASPTLD